MNFFTWDSVTIATLASGTKGYRNYATSSQNGMEMQSRTFGANLTTIAMGCRVYRGDTNLCSLLSAGDAGGLGVNPSGYLVWTYHSQWRMDITDCLTGTVALTEDEWSFVEVYVEFSSTATGTCRLYVNGSLDTEWTSQRTLRTGPGANFLEVGQSYYPYFYWPNTNWAITDIYVDDAQVHGVVEMWWQPADSAGSAAGFTPSAGSNYENVDEIPNDGDTTYNQSSTPGTKDSIAHSSAVTFAPGAIQPFALVRGFDGYGAGVQVGVLSGAVEDLEDQINVLGDSYQWVVGTIYEEDPATASAWDMAGANAAESVVKHVAM